MALDKNAIINSAQTDDIVKNDGTTLKWREIWRPANKVLPNTDNKNILYLGLCKVYDERLPQTSARIVHFDGSQFYSTVKDKKYYLDIEYWIPFPEYIDSPMKGVIRNRVNLQFPLFVLAGTIARAFVYLQKQNRLLLRELRIKQQTIDNLLLGNEINNALLQDVD